MWTWTAVALLVCLIGPLIRCLRGDAVNRLVALEAASTICVILLLVLCQAYHRMPFADVALTLAILAFGAGLVFARFLERWL